MIEPYFKEEHHMLRDMVRDFAENEIAPNAAAWDQAEQLPAELIPKLAELGLLGIPFPEEYGGAGMDTLAFTIAVEELARVDASVAITVAAHISLGTMPIYLFGTEEQKKKYLPALTSGKYLGCFGLTEPEAGSDAGGTQTKATKVGQGWLINGSKNFITNSGFAGTCVLTARTDSQSQGNRGISVFLVETDTPGFEVGPPEKKMGWRASDTHPLTFQNMLVPEDALLGELNHGFRQMLITLEGGRISVAAMSLGLAEAALDAALRYSDEREAFGHKIHYFQGVSFPMAEIATEIEAARRLIYYTSYVKDQGGEITKLAAMAKLFASELAVKATNIALQVHGGYGYTKEYAVERYFRDAKILTIGEGTSEIQKLVIIRELLKTL